MFSQCRAREKKTLCLVLANASQGKQFELFFSKCSAGGNIWSFLTNAPQGKFLGKNDPRFLGSLLKKIIRQRKNRIVEGPPSENPPFGRVDPPSISLAVRAVRKKKQYGCRSSSIYLLCLFEEKVKMLLLLVLFHVCFVVLLNE